MNESEISFQTSIETRILECPRCRKRFQRESGIMFTCKTCGDSNNTCGHFCCPHCGYSWSIE